MFMNTVLERDQSVMLHNISWSSYEQITDALQDETPAHFTYDDGRLEIMVLSLKHESLKKLLAMLFERLADNLKVEIFAAGSTTFRRKDLARGFEPDESYYAEHAEMMRSRDTVDLNFDPPPDVTIEVDVHHSSIDRLSIFASMGIKEVWRYDGGVVEILILLDGSYALSTQSRVLPGVEAAVVTELLEIGQSSKRTDFLQRIDGYTGSIVRA